MPDLNSLPLSSRTSASPVSVSSSGIPVGASDGPGSERSRESISPSPTSGASPVSLAATATINAGLQSLPSHSRRSSSSSTALNQSNSSNSNSNTSNSQRTQGALTPRTLRERETRIDARRNARMAPLTLYDVRSTPQPESQSGHGLIAAPLSTVSPLPIGPSSNGTMRDPYHHRQPSLGEIHQELEQEQEAQVNRLLQMIRQQQQQLQQAQQASGLLPSNTGYSAVDDSTPTSERSFSFPSSQLTTTVTNPRPRSPTPQGQPRASVDLSRQSSRRSRTSSRRTSSPSLLPLSAGLGYHGDGGEHGWLLGGSRDESAFYQAETQTLTRENQMLRQRIRELERQVNELNANAAGTAPPSNPTTPPVYQDHNHFAGSSASITEGEEGKD